MVDSSSEDLHNFFIVKTTIDDKELEVGSSDKFHEDIVLHVDRVYI